jgi:hypothetical protein
VTIEELVSALTEKAPGKAWCAVVSRSDWIEARAGLRVYLNENNPRPVMEADIPRENFMCRATPVLWAGDVGAGDVQFTLLWQLGLPEVTGLRYERGTST